MWYRQGNTDVFGDKHVPLPQGLGPGSNPGLCGKRVPLNSAPKIHFLQHSKYSQPLLRRQQLVLLREIIENPIQMDGDGMMPVPEGPGLGIELNEKAVERFRVDK